MNIIENNKLIDLFMDNKGIEIPVYDQNGNRISTEYRPIEYNNSWNMLMLTVDKIESLGYMVSIINKNVSMSLINDCDHTVHISATTKKEAIYLAIVDFIEWYNNKYKNNDK